MQRERATRTALATVFALHGALGCSEPRYEPRDLPDAEDPAPPMEGGLPESAPDASLSDASAAPDAPALAPTGEDASLRDGAVTMGDMRDAAPVDPPRPGSTAALLGEYGVIARFRARDNIGNWLYEELIARARIDDDGAADSLRMGWEICEIRTRVQLTGFPEIRSSILYPDKLQRRELRVAVDGSGFSTSGEPLRFGFVELSAEECPPGTKQRHPERTWLEAGECNCPSSSALPTRADDCRVVDDDGDGRPATSVLFTVPRDNLAYTVSRDRSQLVDGIIAPNGKHAASYRTDAETFQIACQTPPCTRGSVSFCPAKANPVRFIPLAKRPDDAAWTCGDIMREIDANGAWGLESPVKPSSGPDC